MLAYKPKFNRASINQNEKFYSSYRRPNAGNDCSKNIYTKGPIQ